MNFLVFTLLCCVVLILIVILTKFRSIKVIVGFARVIVISIIVIALNLSSSDSAEVVASYPVIAVNDQYRIKDSDSGAYILYEDDDLVKLKSLGYIKDVYTDTSAHLDKVRLSWGYLYIDGQYRLYLPENEGL